MNLYIAVKRVQIVILMAKDAVMVAGAAVNKRCAI